MSDKSHHKPGGGFTNPWPSFRDLTLYQTMTSLMTNWDREGSRVPVVSDLYVKVLEEKKMAWDKIRNPPKDRIQTTWLGHASFFGSDGWS